MCCSLFHNCFDYVDFRRFSPERSGEAMRGEAWARENLYSKTAQKAEFELRYDSPVTIWLNIERPYSGGEFGYRLKLISMHKIFIEK